MKRASSNTDRNARFILYTVLAAAFVIIAWPQHICRPSRSDMAEAVSNCRQIKIILDSFALDHNGEYPSDKTAAKYKLPTPATSNDYFRQLFANGDTKNEKVFWTERSKLCHRTGPDDLTTDPDGTFSPAETLRPGDNAWAYVKNQASANQPDHPLLFDSPPTASGLTFDPELWGKKVIVARIDGSVKAEHLNPENLLLGKDILTPFSIAYPTK